ncbi:MAG: NUDIX domain-containing protein [Methylococcales bacterium]|nr:NUDIX domain-containing protein [Methylococcales bacterium]
MCGSNYIKNIRSNIGNSILLIPSVAAVVLNEKKELLLHEKENELWSLPAGMIEPNESPKDAIIREVQEETGLIIKPVDILGVFGGSEFNYTYSNKDEVGYTVILMLCSIVSATGRIIDSESLSTKYFSQASMPKLALPYPKSVLFNECSSTYIQ